MNVACGSAASGTPKADCGDTSIASGASSALNSAIFPGFALAMTIFFMTGNGGNRSGGARAGRR
jgi:hypothetical protein